MMKTEHHIHERGCYLTASNGSSVIVDLPGHCPGARQHRHAAEQQHYVPGMRIHSAVKTDLPQGESWPVAPSWPARNPRGIGT